MKKGWWGVGGLALLRLGTIHRSFWGGREYLCAFSGSALSSLYATWTVPAGVTVPCGHHLWGTEKNDRCVKKLAYISVVLGGDNCCVWGVRGWV